MTRAASGVCMRSHRSSGFSLVELMIAMVLGLFLTSAIFALLLASGRAQATQSALSRLQENGRIAISVLTADLQLAGHLPCGSQIRPQVYVDALSPHLEGRPPSADAPQGARTDTPYLLDRGIFVSGNACSASACAPALPAALGIPKSGNASGDRVPGTDVLTLRTLQGESWSAEAFAAGSLCKADDKIDALRVGGLPPAEFDPSHLALLASCTRAQIFAVDATLRPIAGKFGQPECDGSSTQPLRLFDLDAQMQTSVYYLQIVQDATSTSRRIATLMRRTNGVVNEVVQGVERFDLRYSVHAANGTAHWLSADRIDQGNAQDGSTLLCDATAMRRCSWSDIDAVDVDLLLNTVDDLPFDGTAAAMQFRYSPDGDGMQVPGAKMPVSGLSAGRMLRREFHTVVALRSLKT